MERVERTFLGTDLVGSTRLWSRHPDAMPALLKELNLIASTCVREHGGSVFKSTGDGHFAAFLKSQPAVYAALSIRDQVAGLKVAGEPVQLRLVLHGGEAEEIDGDFFGPPLNLLGRLLKATHGGQVVATGWIPEWWFEFDSQLLGGFMVSGFEHPVHLSELSPTGPSKLPKLTNAQDLYKSLPFERTPLVGRQQEVDAIRRSLHEHPLTTLVGPGGVGKTRLAVHLAHTSLGSFAKGMWMLSLVQMKPGDDLMAELERVIGCKLRDKEDGFAALANRLTDEPALLILDNAEHMRDQVTKVVRRLERAAPSLRILVTSRESLGSPGERVIQVGPMLPEGSEAMELFTARVRDFRPDWNPTNEDCDLIRTVCKRLDGVPFALELAAVRMRTMSLADLAETLGEGLSAVGKGFREERDRQESLADVVKWSIDLLTEEERCCLLRLAVAEPGFDVKAVRAIASLKRPPAGEFVDSLVAKSLLVFDERHYTYSMLQITRSVALALLEESGEAESARNAHFYEYMGRVLPRLDDLRGEKQTATLFQWDIERANILAAFEYGMGKPSLENVALSAAGVFWRYWSMRGSLSEGIQRLSRMLVQLVGDEYPQPQAQTRRGLAWLSYLKGDVRLAEEMARSALPFAGRTGDPVDKAACHSLLGSILAWRGLFEEAAEQYQRAYEGFERAGDQPNLARTTLHLGDAALSAGDTRRARRNVEAAREAFVALGDELAGAWALYSLGRCEEAEGNRAEAEACYLESKRIREDRRDQRGVAYAQQALCAVSQGSDRDAIDLGLEAIRTFLDMGEDGGVMAAALSLARRLESSSPTLAAKLASFAKRKAAEIDLALGTADAAHLDRLAMDHDAREPLENLVEEAEEVAARLT